MFFMLGYTEFCVGRENSFWKNKQRLREKLNYFNWIGLKVKVSKARQGWHP